MAAGTLAAPGTEYGPCEQPCAHTDCEATRTMAATGCRICHEPIGYDRAFFQEEGKVLVHATCAYDEAEEKVICTSCGAATDPLAVFPGKICLDCYRKTPEAHAPLTSDDIVRMWGGKP